MEKSRKTLDYLLKDFLLNSDYRENWVDEGKGTKSLKRFPFKLPENLKVKHPFMIFIIFRQIKQYPTLPIFEKVLWEIPILYKGFNFVLAHRKFGFDISSDTEDETFSAMAIEAMIQIHKAIPHAEGLINGLIKAKVSENKVTIESRYTEIRNRYLFFREKINETESSDIEKLKIANLEFKNASNSVDLLSSYEKVQRLKAMHTNYILAMIDAYFSLLEHVFVLLLPFMKHLNKTTINLEKFMSENWKPKIQLILEAKNDNIATKFIEILDEIKEQIRNPASHGHFYKKGNSFYVHMERVGAIPFTLTKSKTNFKYSFQNGAFMTFEDICKHFDDFDNFLETGSTRYGLQYIKRNLPVAFDKRSSSTYKRRMITDKSTVNYIEETIRKLENNINMDW